MFPVLVPIFWVCLSILFYTYAGYPLLLLLLVFIKRNFIRGKFPENNIYVPLTMVVAVYNEEDIIEEKIKNCYSLDYPKDKINFLFITDGSTDNSVSIINRFSSITHFHEPERKGKLAAMNRAMRFVDTEFVVFSDANTMLNKESISRLMRHYSDKKVGGVAGEKKIITSDDGAVSKGEGAYWKYESFIKNLDSRLCTIVGAAGELFSIRTSLYTSLPQNIILDDFVQSLTLCTKGFVIRYEPEAFALEKASLSIKDEMERKVRISAGGFQAIAFLKTLFNVFSHPLLSFQYISHRVLRWTLCPLALIGLFATSVMLWWWGGSVMYGYFAMLQAVFYLAALVGWLKARKNVHPGVFYLPFYFAFMHFCVFAGFARYVSGRQGATWKKAERNGKI